MIQGARFTLNVSWENPCLSTFPSVMAITPDTTDTSAATEAAEEICPAYIVKALKAQAKRYVSVAIDNALTRAQARFTEELDDYKWVAAYCGDAATGLLAGSNHYVPYALKALELSATSKPDFKALGTVKQLKGGTALYCHENGGKDGPADITNEDELPALLKCLQRFKDGESAPKQDDAPTVESDGEDLNPEDRIHAMLEAHGGGRPDEKWTVSTLDRIIATAEEQKAKH